MVYEWMAPFGEGLSIADFSCGDGALLRMAPVKKDKVIGVDIDHDAIAQLRTVESGWILHCGDFLEESGTTANFLSEFRNRLDLVVLNPPFSCKSGVKYSARFHEVELTCSRAMAFLIKSLDFLNEGGSAMAIMPLSCLRSSKDEAALAAISRHWNVSVGNELERKTFKGCRPKSICLVLTRTSTRKDEVVTMRDDDQCTAKTRIFIVRGSMPMYKCASTGTYPVLHTVDVREFNGASSKIRFSEQPGRSAVGNTLIIPRVGQPDLRKLKILSLEKPFILSDCLYGLQGRDDEATLLLGQLVREKWEHLELLYRSTCAPYLTLKQLTHFLASIGFESEITSALPNLPNGVNLRQATFWVGH